MPDKAGTGARGIFQRGKDPQMEIPGTEATPGDIAVEQQGQLTVIVLGLLNRVHNLEAVARQARRAALFAEEAVRTIVLDNDQAEDRIAELEKEVRDLTRELTAAGEQAEDTGRIDAMIAGMNRVEMSLDGVLLEMIAEKLHFHSMFANLNNAIVDLKNVQEL